jgi:dienelactone hydrolase
MLHVRRRLAWLLLALLSVASALPASAKPPLEAYGDAPRVRSAQVSPDGNRIAYLNRIEGEDVLFIHDLRKSESKPLARLQDLRANGLGFISDKYVTLIVSQTRRLMGYRGRWDESTAFAVDLETGKFVQLLRNTENLYPAQSGLGDIVAVDEDGEHVYMPAFMGRGSDPSFDVVKVSLKSGRGLKAGGREGIHDSIDWLVNSKGEVIAREDFREKQQLHEIRVYSGRESRLLFSEKTPLLNRSLIGVTTAGDKLIVSDRTESEFLTLYEMSMTDGALTGPLLVRTDADIEGVILDNNRVVKGVRYAGMLPDYEMFDPEIDKAIRIAQASLPGSAVSLTSWSDDWSKLLFHVSGGPLREAYVLFDRPASKLLTIATLRPDIGADDVGETITVEYKARDGLTIPALITWPARVPEENRKNLPLVVLPHGGPESYDSIGFDWLAQFLANEGYMVLQPNFRGSAGFGAAFRDAGRGQWGRKMQDDITDGALALASMGWADPKRSCIAGWSYGGYAALAGGALTPEMYKCVVSIAGVSDLREMLANERTRHGALSRTVTYWEMLIGDTQKDREAIDAVSPARLADKFQAPVLLVHGTDDLIVPASQSKRMQEALRKAGKEVQYIEFKGDDHGLRTDASRRDTLTAIAAFLREHIGTAN